MVYKKDTTLGQTKEFAAQIQVLDSQRDQGWLLANWLCALRPLGLPHLQAHMEDGKRDRGKKNGRSPLLEVQRDGRMLLPTSAAARRRYLQKLRRTLTCGLHGW